MNRTATIITAALFSLATMPLGGCMASTYGQRIEADNVSRIIKGTTTRNEVIAMFGQPMQTVINPAGGRTMMFVYYRSSIGSVARQYGQVFSGNHRADGSTANLTVVVDTNDVVTDFEYQPARQ